MTYEGRERRVFARDRKAGGNRVIYARIDKENRQYRRRLNGVLVERVEFGGSPDWDLSYDRIRDPKPSLIHKGGKPNV